MTTDFLQYKQQNHIIIIEGRDRLGKTTCIQSLVDQFQEDTRNSVHTLFSSIKTNSTIPLTHHEFHYRPFEKTYQTHPFIRDFQSCSFEAIGYMIKKLFEAEHKNMNDQNIIIIDRLQLSAYVYMRLLREDNMIQLHETTKLFMTYVHEFEKYIQQLANVHLIMLTTNEATVVDDTSNPLTSITANDINVSNQLFKFAFDQSMIKSKHSIDCKSDESGWFNSLTQVSDLVKTFNII